MPSNAGISVAVEPFHRRFTDVEDFGSKSALIEIHLLSIDMIVSLTVNSVNTAYLPGKTFTSEVYNKVKKCNIKTKPNGDSVSQGKRRLLQAHSKHKMTGGG